jgi:hypothetical protein
MVLWTNWIAMRVLIHSATQISPFTDMVKNSWLFIVQTIADRGIHSGLHVRKRGQELSDPRCVTAASVRHRRRKFNRRLMKYHSFLNYSQKKPTCCFQYQNVIRLQAQLRGQTPEAAGCTLLRG